ncbi:sigma factor [Anoxynatronum sibiricum]|uniref:Sigma factor n=1 Tax=Anoxynatronum sibiricum TaxID=210623 RepID=A0ABU9VSU7_9CLOT
MTCADADRSHSINLQQQGTPPSFDILMNRYQSMITGFLRSRTVSTQLAEDISQEVWLKAWQHWEQFDPAKGTEASYLLAIARYEVINYWRRTRSKEPILLEIKNLDHCHLQVLSAEAATLDEMEEEEVKEWYTRLLRTLMTEGGYPHQVLAFLYSRVIHCSEDTSERTSGYPAKTAQQQGHLPLGSLHRQAAGHYSQKSHLNHEEVSTCFQALQPALNTLLETLFQKAGDTVSLAWAREHNLHHTPSKHTRLADYTRADKLEKAVTDWSYKVARRLKKNLMKQTDLIQREGE